MSPSANLISVWLHLYILSCVALLFQLIGARLLSMRIGDCAMLLLVDLDSDPNIWVILDYFMPIPFSFFIFMVNFANGFHSFFSFLKAEFSILWSDPWINFDSSPLPMARVNSSSIWPRFFQFHDPQPPLVILTVCNCKVQCQMSGSRCEG